MNDIQTDTDIETLVSRFYTMVRQDDLLAPIFNSRIDDAAWPGHLQSIQTFWKAILFSKKGFQGNPMEKHLNLPVDHEHFKRWLTLFNQTIDEEFAGAKATEAKKRAASIAAIMNLKIQNLKR